MSKLESQAHQYTPYDQIDKEQLKKDIEEIKATIGAPSEEDFQHLLKMERWGYILTASGFAIVLLLAIASITSGFLFWSLAIVAAVLISTGNVGR